MFRRKSPAERAERGLSKARAAFKKGDHRRAARLTADALTHAPTSSAVHEMLGRLADLPQGGRSLFPLDDPLTLASVVSRAHVVAREGDYSHALELLGKAQRHQVETPWAAVPWVIGPALPLAADPAGIAELLLGFLPLVDAPCPEELRPAMLPYLVLARNAVARHAEHADLLCAAGAFVRRFAPDEAVDYTTRADRLAPSEKTAVMLGFALQSQGRLDEAFEAWDRALGHNPANLDIYADIGELLLDADRLDDARVYAERALALDPGHVCSQITLHVVGFRRTRSAADHDALLALVDAQIPGTHAHSHAVRALYGMTMKTADHVMVLGGEPD